MRQMSKEVARWTPHREVMMAPYHQRYALVAEATRLSRRGDIRIVAPRPVWDQERSAWLMPIIRVRPPAPAWMKRFVVAGGVLVSLALLLLLGAWLLTTLSGAALFTICLFAIGALALLLRAGVRPKVSVTTTTTVEIR